MFGSPINQPEFNGMSFTGFFERCSYHHVPPGFGGTFGGFHQTICPLAGSGNPRRSKKTGVKKNLLPKRWVGKISMKFVELGWGKFSQKMGGIVICRTSMGNNLKMDPTSCMEQTFLYIKEFGSSLSVFV